jgi:hypothetical protein
MVAIYPIGVPLMYFVLLHSRRSILRDGEAIAREERMGSPNIGHLYFLISGYKPELYYFEVSKLKSFQCILFFRLQNYRLVTSKVLECIRRLVFSVAIGFVFQGSSVISVLMAIVSSLACLYVCIKWSPFNESGVASLSVVVSYSLTFLFFVGLLIKAGVRFGNNLFAIAIFVIFSAPFVYTVGCIFLKNSSVIAFMSKLYEVKAENRLERSEKDDLKDLFSAFNVVDDSDIFLMFENLLIQNDLFESTSFISSYGSSSTSFQDPVAGDVFLCFDINPEAEFINREPFYWSVSIPSILDSFLSFSTKPSAVDNKSSPVQDSIVNSSPFGLKVGNNPSLIGESLSTSAYLNPETGILLTDNCSFSDFE